MKRSYYKDSKKMFKNNIFRFISIVLIIMLGTAFFVGMNSISPDMKKTAEKYIKDQNIFDISLVSNLGYEQEDIKEFEKQEDIVKIQGSYTYDALTKFEEKDIAVRLTSYLTENTLNKNSIIEGRNIESENECLIDSRLKNMYGYEIGQTISIYRKDEVKIEDSLNKTEFKIVGVTRNPIYLSKFYGKTTLSTGEIYGYIMVKENVFKLENYTALYVKTNIDEDISRFSKEYEEKLNDIATKIEEINNNIITEKYNKIYEENSKSIADYEEKILNAEDYVVKVRNQIRDSQIKINYSIAYIIEQISNMYNQSTLSTEFYNKATKIQNLYSSLQNTNNEQQNLQTEYEDLKIEKENLEKQLKKLSNLIDKNLYEIYVIKDETKYVKLNKENNELYYEYNKQSDQLKLINEKYEQIETQLQQKIKDIDNFKNDIETNQSELYASFNTLENLIYGINNEELIANLNNVKTSITAINSNKKELEDKNYDIVIEQAKTKLNDEKEKLNNFETVTELTKLYENSSFKSLKEDLQKVAIMGKIFPVMFFVIAALVTITTITRMIEVDRKNIGTLKALGYSKNTILIRYILYSLLSTLIGVILGIIIGITIIVEILFVAYGSLYDLPNLSTRVNIDCIALVTIISLLATVLVTLIVTLKELKENAATLMRPKTTKEGKNILFERVPFIWNKLDFLFKICFRNIFRYKRRLCMTLIGIAGCTALIYAGLGLQSSVNNIGNKQFTEIRKLNLEVYFKQEINYEQSKKVSEFIENQENVTKATPVRQQSLTVEANDNKKEIFYIVADEQSIGEYINLKERKSQDKIKLNDDGVVITEKLSYILKVDVGDKIKILDNEIEVYVKVIGVTENYLYNFMYLTPKVYENIYGEEIKYNQIFVNMVGNLTEEEERVLAENIKQNENISGIVLERQNNEEFQTSLTSLMSIVILFIGCASLLSFVVLVNLNNINIEERKRELATIKLLGFYKREMESYVFRENIILTIFGTIIGLVFGVAILGVIIQSAEVETIFLSKEPNITNMLIASIMTISFTLITNLFMKKKIKNIDMIDSLKSIE